MYKVKNSVLVICIISLSTLSYLFYTGKVCIPGYQGNSRDFDSIAVTILQDSSLQIALYDVRTKTRVRTETVEKLTPNDGFTCKHAQLNYILPYICTWYNLTPLKIYPKGEINGHVRLDLSRQALISRLEELSGLKFNLEKDVLLVNCDAFFSL